MKKFFKVACELRLLKEIATVQTIFHISLLNKCVGDVECIIPLQSVAMKDRLYY